MGGSDHGQESSRPLDTADAAALERFRDAWTASTDAGTAGRPGSLPDRLCRVVREALPVDAVAISVYEKPDIAVPVGSSDWDVAAAESLQFTLREGPCLSAYETGQAAGISDVAQPDARASGEWPHYLAEVARHTPYRAVVAYPLLMDGKAMGSLSVYRRNPGRPAILADLVDSADLTDLTSLIESADAISGIGVDVPVNAITVMTVAITTALLEAEMSAGTKGESLHPWIAGPATEARQRVWVAQGMIMALNRLNSDQALDLLRAHAYTAGRLIDAVATDIVTRHLPVPDLDVRP